MKEKPILAMMYDFDRTLSPRDMEEYAFIPGLGMSAKEFWSICNQTAIRHEMDGILAYMLEMLRLSEGKQLVTRRTLNEVGRHVELFPGVDTWFSRVNAYAASKGLTAEHYSISSGIKEIIEGTSIAGEFKKIYAASFCYNEKGVPFWPATAVNYTAKTQFIYRINKGVLDVSDDRALNSSMPDDSKRIPFRNMLYIGDGLSDVPCMKMTRAYGGQAIAVYQDSNRAAVEELLCRDRVNFIFPADYRAGTPLDETVRDILRHMAISDRLAETHTCQVRKIGTGEMAEQERWF